MPLIWRQKGRIDGHAEDFQDKTWSNLKSKTLFSYYRNQTSNIHKAVTKKKF